MLITVYVTSKASGQLQAIINKVFGESKIISEFSIVQGGQCP